MNYFMGRGSLGVRLLAVGNATLHVLFLQWAADVLIAPPFSVYSLCMPTNCTACSGSQPLLESCLALHADLVLSGEK